MMIQRQNDEDCGQISKLFPTELEFALWEVGTEDLEEQKSLHNYCGLGVFYIDSPL